ncbi:cobalamin-binding protein [Motilimonas sp. 1_MG-2023]|uniref:cobalamin-binding protein n=1 Tax=Motilimonas sp. 1_MG-2023 TaxID=3062672 RepID=UPI0026E29A6A|nr:cobalamin-binding protein [Motilimonas sp. 1_MG-2023]MDO6524645.1 cobalamin-binding protein [Motilimonas sp. 1_MG-2023]
MIKSFISLVKASALAGVGLMLVTAHVAAESQQVIKQPVKRIITLSPHSAEMLFAIGQGDKIVGTTRFTDYPEAAKSIPVVGGYNGLNIEQIIQLEPDVIISWGSGNSVRELNQLSSLGLTLVDSDTKTLAGIADTIIMLGELTGAQEKAKQVANDYLKQLQLAQAKYSDAPKVTVFYQLWPNPLRTVAKGSWVQQYIEVCGGENPFYDNPAQYPVISTESVLSVAPQAIVMTDEVGQKQTINWQQWRGIPAVANEAIFTLNADWLHRATPRSILGVNALCDALEQVRQQKLKPTSS